MTLNNEKKKEILLQSFNVLKKDIYQNADSLGSLILKMAELDVSTALEMWKYTLENYKEIGKSSHVDKYLTGEVVYWLVRKVDVAKISKFILDDQSVRNKLYHESAHVDDQLVAYFIDGNQLDKANDILDLINSNMNFLRAQDGDPLGEYLYYLFNLYCKNITHEKMNFILSWVEKVPTEEARAKLHVLLIEYM
ncbi:MAG TPA: hypothetical protein VFC41_08240 [Anaerovoracaceae bacterium]|nr:hypothetical protein [Anaerovoracaceae bacterium]